MLARSVISTLIDRLAIVSTERESGWTLMADLNSVYRERNELVAALAAHHGGVVGIDPTEPDWPVVYIELPNGQVSWHFGPDDLDLIEDFPRSSEVVWDGHTNEEKYDRIREFVKEMIRNGS